MSRDLFTYIGLPIQFKKNIGFILLGIVVCCRIAVPILPFFDIPNKTLTITTIFIIGEILFIISIALLGKEYRGLIKSKVRNIFKKTKQN